MVLIDIMINNRYWSSNSLSSPAYNTRSLTCLSKDALVAIKDALSNPIESSALSKPILSSNKKPRSNRRSSKHRRNKAPTCHGIARLFPQVCNKTGICQLVIIHKRKYSAQDCTKTDGICSTSLFGTPLAAINNDDTITVFIDNTNLGKPSSKPGEKSKPGRKYRLCALSNDNKSTWRLALILNDHPKNLIYCFCHYDADHKLVIHKERHHLVLDLEGPLVVVNKQTKKITINNCLTVHYVNEITLESNANDGFIECDIYGPKTVHEDDVHNEHNIAVRQAINTDQPIVDKATNHYSSVRTLHNFVVSKPKDRPSLAKLGKFTTFCEVGESEDSGVAILVPNESDSTTVTAYFVPPNTIQTLRNLSELDEQRLPRSEFVEQLQRTATSTKQLPVSIVGRRGLVLESSTDPDLIGESVRENKLIAPRQRKGGIVVDWHMGSNNTKIDTVVLCGMMGHAYNLSSSCVKRDAASNFNVNMYFGKAGFRPRPTPRKSKESISRSHRHNESIINNALLIPRITNEIEKLTAEANEVSKASDPDYYNFLLKVNDMTTDGQQVRCNNRPAYLHNLLAILTLMFFNTRHKDKNDSFGINFANHGLRFIKDKLEQECLQRDSSARNAKVEMLQDTLLHLLRLGRQPNGTINWRLNATCGYIVSYPENTDRKVSAHFVYNSIDRAVEIPQNQTAYQTFDTSLDHQTAMPFTYDDEYVYLNDKSLSIVAWGCGKGKSALILT